MDVTRESTAAAVAERRLRHRKKGLVLRVAVAFFAASLLIVAIPLVVLLPEVGLPVLLWALSLLALEFDWAAQVYSWLTWRWHQFHSWYKQQRLATKAAVVVATLAVALGLVALLFLH